MISGYSVWALIAVSLLGAALLYVPGTLTLRLFGFNWGRALIGAPAISAALYFLVAELCALVHLPWGPVPITAFLVVLVVAVWARQRKAVSGSRATQLLAPVRGALLWGMGAFAVYLLVQLPALVKGMGVPDMFPQIGDAQFHLQGAKLIQDSGNASPFSALSDLYASDGNTYYPTLWHSLVVLLSFSGNLVLGTNALAITVGLILWPITLGALAFTVTPDSKYGPAMAIMAATPLVLMPGIQVFAFGVYPFVLSLIIFASALPIFFWWLQKPTWIGFGVALIAVIGGAAAQPATGVFLAGALAVTLLVYVLSWATLRFREGDRLVGIGAGAGSISLFIAGLLAVPLIGPMRKLGTLGHPSVTYQEAGVQLLSGNVYFIVERPFGGKLALALWVFILALIVLGFARLLRSRPGVVLTLLAVMSLTAYFLASGPENYLRRITAIWWKDQTRFSLYLLVVLLVAFAAGTTWLLREVSIRLRAPATAPAFMGAWLLVSAVSALPFNHLWLGSGRTEWIDRTYGGITGGDFGLTSDHFTMLNDLNQLLSPEDVVVGSPRDGVPWSNILTDVGQYPLWKTETGPDEVYLRDNFDNIHIDPLVCEMINDHGVTALLRSENVPIQPDDPHRAYLEVDTSSGFELVAQRGDVHLYRITECAGER